MKPFGNITPIQYIAGAVAIFVVIVLVMCLIADAHERRNERRSDALDAAARRHPSHGWDKLYTGVSVARAWHDPSGAPR